MMEKKIGCKYCLADEDGHILDERIELFNGGVTLKYQQARGKGLQKVDIEDYDNTIFLSALIWDRNKLNFYSTNGVTISKSIEINYCPMCGRKLTEEKK